MIRATPPVRVTWISAASLASLMSVEPMWRLIAYAAPSVLLQFQFPCDLYDVSLVVLQERRELFGCSRPWLGAVTAEAFARGVAALRCAQRLVEALQHILRCRGGHEQPEEVLEIVARQALFGQRRNVRERWRTPGCRHPKSAHFAGLDLRNHRTGSIEVDVDPP